MAKIKSTIDLIMEKTKNMSLNEEEKKAVRQKDLEDRVKIFTFRFIKEERDGDSLVSELKLFSEEEQEEAKRICFNILLGQFSPFDENSRALQGIEKIIRKIPYAQFQKTIEEVRKEFRKKEEDLRKQAASQCYKELASKGIGGSALVPRIEATPFWQAGSQKLIESSQGALRKKLEGML